MQRCPIINQSVDSVCCRSKLRFSHCNNGLPLGNGSCPSSNLLRRLSAIARALAVVKSASPVASFAPKYPRVSRLPAEPLRKANRRVTAGEMRTLKPGIRALEIRRRILPGGHTALATIWSVKSARAFRYVRIIAMTDSGPLFSAGCVRYCS